MINRTFEKLKTIWAVSGRKFIGKTCKVLKTLGLSRRRKMVEEILVVLHVEMRQPDDDGRLSGIAVQRTYFESGNEMFFQHFLNRAEIIDIILK